MIACDVDVKIERTIALLKNGIAKCRVFLLLFLPKESVRVCDPNLLSPRRVSCCIGLGESNSLVEPQPDTTEWTPPPPPLSKLSPFTRHWSVWSVCHWPFSGVCLLYFCWRSLSKFVFSLVSPIDSVFFLLGKSRFTFRAEICCAC